jgi:AcrR family transcriptional regulator
MKRIAAELGAATMTLYYYVRNKSDIVALMQDAILADVLVPEGVDNYVSGNVLHAVESLARAKVAEADPAMAAAAVAYGVAQLQTGEFPQLSAIYAESAQSAGPPTTEDALTEQFERGLAALLDGLAARKNIS